MLQKIVCSVTYHDQRFKADNISYHTYWNDDLIHNALVNNYTTPNVIKEPTRIMSAESDMDYQ